MLWASAEFHRVKPDKRLQRSMEARQELAGIDPGIIA
jgi:hypothetical protein